jgi:hypothetical protein
MIAVQPAQGEHDAQQKRQRDEQAQNFDRLKPEEEENGIARQQAVGDLAQVIGEPVAEDHRQQHQRGRQQGQADLPHQVTVNDGRHVRERSVAGLTVRRGDFRLNSTHSRCCIALHHPAVRWKYPVSFSRRRRIPNRSGGSAAFHGSAACLVLGPAGPVTHSNSEEIRRWNLRSRAAIQKNSAPPAWCWAFTNPGD